MALLDDLKASHAAMRTAIAAIGVNANEIKTGITDLATRFQGLLDLIASMPVGQVPQDVVDEAKAMQADLDALVVKTQSAEDQIAAIPPGPASG